MIHKNFIIIVEEINKMNYKKIYNDLMEKSKSENRIKNNGIYYEVPHIYTHCIWNRYHWNLTGGKKW